ncbi:corticotropin-releasing factor receptor 1 [Caerostris extrusa]|uniref:Corticotropin-releasing factor receptor 1 n=1 Tax=Caerostris extrusa TaxID=172846 RepID=A0AAV4YA17_CAEEX|nr:corticotropin-releasing factor receptor 1 [Caerostris extrusa]
MSSNLDTDCWEGYGRSPFVWIITGPMIGALGINLIFLVNIIRILVTKMKTSSTFEIVQIRRAMKSHCSFVSAAGHNPPAVLCQPSRRQ